MIDNPGPWITNFASLHHFRRRILLLPSFLILLVLLGIWIPIVNWITPEFTLLIVKSSISVYHHWLNQFLLEFIARYWSILMLPAPCSLALLALGLRTWIFTSNPPSVDTRPSFVPPRYRHRRDRNVAWRFISTSLSPTVFAHMVFTSRVTRVVFA